MIRWTLRLRLALAFCALASLILFIGLASYVIHATVREDFRQMRTGSTYDLLTHDMETTGLEIEGYWNPAGSFVAQDIQPQPPLDPRLRGPIQSLDPEAKTLRVHGIDVAIVEKTDNGDDETQPVPFSTLRPGQRVEIKCEVEEGRWLAKKLYTKSVNTSDKVKGMVTRKALDGQPPESIFIHDLEIVVDAQPKSSPTSALTRVEQGGRMLVQLQACRSAAFALASESAGQGAAANSAPGHALTELEEATSTYGAMLTKAHEEGDDPHSVPLPRFLKHLDALRTAYVAQQAHVDQLAVLAEQPQSQDRIRRYIYEQLTPFLDREVSPRLETYLWEGEEELGDQLRAILKRAEWTPRLALGVSVIAVAVAVILGWLLWRSINIPLQRLQNAAIRIGSGHLETRIPIEHDDELGMLSGAFNRMASDLSSTTLSMESVESVLDSMDSALFVFDSEGRIVRVNRAACLMTGFEREELLGQAFDVICRGTGEDARAMLAGLVPDSPRSLAAALGIEREFVHKQGRVFPVALSGAELGSDTDTEQGIVCVAQDLTEQKRIQKGIRDSLAEKELLLREVHHRVKNNMQVISSLLAIQASEGDPEIAMRLEESQSRVRTIALIHEHLYLSDELAHIDLQGYLGVLTEHLRHTFGRAQDVKVELDIEDIGIDIDQALAVGLIVNELVTNSLKYAFPDSREGTIRVSTRRGEQGLCTLTVRDDGCGYTPVDGTRPPSLGSTLVDAFAKKLKGKVSVTGEDGMRTHIEFTPEAGAESEDPIS